MKDISKNTKKRNSSVRRNNIIQNIIILLILGLSFLFDKIIINIINTVQYPFLFKFFYMITLLGETYIFVWIAILLAAALMIYKRPVAAFILTLCSAAAVEVLIKIIVNRPRPFEALNINSSVITKMSSFPSGHTMMFFAIIPILSKNFPKMRIILWTMAILVGLSRIYLGVHYFSDVMWGAAIGYFIGWLCMKIGERYEWKY
jgi:undecaprenyl-diphosphatase